MKTFLKCLNVGDVPVDLKTNTYLKGNCSLHIKMMISANILFNGRYVHSSYKI